MIINKYSTKEIQEYVNMQKKFYTSIISYLSNEEKETPKILEYQLKKQDIFKEKEELRELLIFICIISNNHHRHPDFIRKMEQVLLQYSVKIKQTFTNIELFEIFESNKKILLFLFEQKIIIPDEFILQSISEKSDIDDINSKETIKDQGFYYKFYFLPEIKNIISDEEIKFDHETFNKKRHIGENDSKLCEMIRNDSIDEFVQYINRNNLSLLSKISPSIFETNSFLINKHPTLIEYSAFFGSIQIFNYLRLNNVKLKSSLWLYAIHSNNADMIHQLERNQVEPPNGSYNECLEESIKCHHNNIANYILDNLIDRKEKLLNNGDIFCKNLILFGFEYRNLMFWPNNLFEKCVFYNLCYNGYYKLVSLYLKYCDFDLEAPIFLPSTITSIIY